MGYDTIHIGFHPPTIHRRNQSSNHPTTCNGASGSITGLTALGPTPYAYRWLDLSEVEYGTVDIDVFGLPAGQYVLQITDGNGCETVSDVYTIEDAGNLQVLDVELSSLTAEGRTDRSSFMDLIRQGAASCSIRSMTALLTRLTVFSPDLVGTSYVIRVTDVNGCEGFYLDNPVLLMDIPGPQVVEVNVTDETDFLGNGSIEIVASGSTPVIYYSIDGGTTWQINDGNFDNLESRIYNLEIRDENGCDTTFTVEIQNVILTYLHAVTGEEGICEGLYRTDSC
jgi:hypothetical protein